MAAKGAELVRRIVDDCYECYIFLGWEQPELPVSYEELCILLDAEIIEFDSGCDEEGYESATYRLTETAMAKVQALVDQEMERRKKLKQLE